MTNTVPSVRWVINFMKFHRHVKATLIVFIAYVLAERLRKEKRSGA